MRKISFKTAPLFFIGIIILSAFTHNLPTTDFSGKWKLNESKSELGRMANFATRAIEATQSEGSMSISRTAPGFDGSETTTKEMLTFDGKEAESTSIGNSSKKSLASWSEDKTILTITYTLQMEFNGQTNEIKGKEIWTLADEGKTLIVTNNSSSSFGDFETKSVYEKQ